MKMKRSKSLTLECLQNWMMSCILWPLGFNRWYSLHSFQLTLRVLSLSMLTILKGKVFLKYINKNYTLQLDLLGEGSLEENFFKWHTTVMMNFKRVQMSLTALSTKLLFSSTLIQTTRVSVKAGYWQFTPASIRPLIVACLACQTALVFWFRLLAHSLYPFSGYSCLLHHWKQLME